MGGTDSELELVYEGVTSLDTSDGYGAARIYGSEVWEYIAEKNFVIIGDAGYDTIPMGAVFKFVIVGRKYQTNASYYYAVKFEGTSSISVGNKGTVRPDTAITIPGSSSFRVNRAFNYRIFIVKS